MGQALQKLRWPGAAVAARTVRSPRPQTSESSELNSFIAAPVEVAGASPAVRRQSQEVLPQAPEPQLIIEPERNLGDWDRGDPKYSAMVQQVVGKITTRPGGEAEMGTAHVNAVFRRPKPMNRHTSAATGPDEEKVVASGSLNIAGIQEALLLYQGFAEGQEKPLGARVLAEKFKVDVDLLERVFQYVSLPDPQRPELAVQTPQQRLKLKAPV